MKVNKKIEINERILGMEKDVKERRIKEMKESLEIEDVMDELKDEMKIGIRKRMQMDVEMINQKDIMIIDEKK